MWLDIAKIEAGKHEMIYETFRVNDLIGDVLNIMSTFADTKSIRNGCAYRGEG